VRGSLFFLPGLLPENGMLEEADAEPEAQCSGSSATLILWGSYGRVKRAIHQ
jgi:hypothetical protein